MALIDEGILFLVIWIHNAQIAVVLDSMFGIEQQTGQAGKDGQNTVLFGRLDADLGQGVQFGRHC